LQEVYLAGGFAGMLLAYNANAATIAANLGAWRPDAANPTGLYTPNLGDQFFRGWISGLNRQAGSWQQDAVQQGITTIHARQSGSAIANWTPPVGGNVSSQTGQGNETTLANGSASLPFTNYSVLQRFAAETRPANVSLPVILYLGRAA
jgi:hypothetical protein